MLARKLKVLSSFLYLKVDYNKDAEKSCIRYRRQTRPINRLCIILCTDWLTHPFFFYYIDVTSAKSCCFLREGTESIDVQEITHLFWWNSFYHHDISWLYKLFWECKKLRLTSNVSSCGLLLLIRKMQLDVDESTPANDKTYWFHPRVAIGNCHHTITCNM